MDETVSKFHSPVSFLSYLMSRSIIRFGFLDWIFCSIQANRMSSSRRTQDTTICKSHWWKAGRLILLCLIRTLSQEPELKNGFLCFYGNTGPSNGYPIFYLDQIYGTKIIFPARPTAWLGIRRNGYLPEVVDRLSYNHQTVLRQLLWDSIQWTARGLFGFRLVIMEHTNNVPCLVLSCVFPLRHPYIILCCSAHVSRKLKNVNSIIGSPLIESMLGFRACCTELYQDQTTRLTAHRGQQLSRHGVPLPL